MRRWLLLLVAVSGSLSCDRVQACCMVPRGFAGRISQRSQQAVLLHHGDRQELILQIDYQISGEKMPSQFAWVVTVPDEPSAYHLADAGIYQAVRLWSNARVMPPPRPTGGGCRMGCTSQAPLSRSDVESSPLEFGRRAQVGPYDIQPVRARGVQALEALNGWLEENGFPREEPAHMKYFVEQRFTFLCIRISPAAGEASVASGGKIPPLQLSFQSDEIYYPLLFSSRQGIFDLQLVVLSGTPLDYRQSGSTLARINWRSGGLYRNVTVDATTFPSALQRSYDKRAIKDVPEQWYLNVLRCRDVNRGESIASWTEDVFLTTSVEAPVHHASRGSVSAGWLWIGVALWAARRCGSFSVRPGPFQGNRWFAKDHADDWCQSDCHRPEPETTLFRRRISLVLCAVVCLSGCLDEGSGDRSGRSGADRRGHRDKGGRAAERSIAADILKLREYPPLPYPPGHGEFVKLLRARCGVGWEVVRLSAGGSSVGLSQEVQGWNDVMRAEIRRRFGADIFTRLDEEARQQRERSLPVRDRTESEDGAASWFHPSCRERLVAMHVGWWITG